MTVRIQVLDSEDKGTHLLMNFSTLLKALLALSLPVFAVLGYTHQHELMTYVKEGFSALDPRAAALAYLLISVVAALVMFPAAVLMIFSGAYFGLWIGFLINLTGFILGATAAFLTGRHLARDQLRQKLPPKALEVITLLGNHGWKTVAVLRGIGLIPSVVANYGLALTNLPLSTFVWASLVFTIPNDFILTYAGVAGEEFLNGGGVGKLTLATTLVVIMATTAYILKNRFLPKK